MSLSSSPRPTASGARASGTAPGGSPNRLPASRERRPALAALAVILILLGAAGSALIALRSGDRQDYVAVSDKALEPGHQIERKDLARGDLAGATGGLVPWSQVDKYIGRYTTTRLFPGQFVTQQNFTAGNTPDVPEGGALVGVSLESGRAPSEALKAGDIVRVIRVPSASNDSGVSEVLVSAAQVTASSGSIADSKTNANSTLNATILVPTEKSTKVAAAAAAKTLVLIKLSASTRTDISRSNGDG
ncbi:MAG TPA: hypothetical protein VFT31_03680 [Kribbella sp.]|nr:hypothetical protein [Kribbella sp.]